MHFQVALILSTVFSDYATAFAPSPLVSSVRSSLVGIEAAAKPPVFPGVNPPSPVDVPEEILYPFTQQRGRDFLDETSIPALSGMLNRLKSDKSTTMLSKSKLISTQKIDTQIPNPEEYKFFGNGEHAKNLVYLLKTNPFMASALELDSDDDGFELRAFDKADEARGDKSAPLFRRIINCLNGGSGHRVNFFFDSEMNIKKVRVYDEISGKRTVKINSKDLISDKDELDKWASSAIYNLGAYASSMHANIHVLHYLLTAGLDVSSEGFEALNQWAKVYATNVPDKYQQVGQLLIRGQPDTQVLLGLRDADKETVSDIDAVLTGSSGFGFDGVQLNKVLVELLNMWCENPSSFVEKMMNIPEEKMKKAGILTEFMKHHDLVPGFAQEVKGALKSFDDHKLVIAEDRLVSYLKRCGGFKSEINSLEDWIQLMATTGIVHGSTLSYTRLYADVDILRWRDIQSNTWQAPDVAIHLKLLSTACGMDEHRHVMTSSTDVVGVEYEECLQSVLEKYDKKANDYKEAYTKEIMKNADEFNNYGWILSDFCVDGFDGKQLTIATYI